VLSLERPWVYDTPLCVLKKLKFDRNLAAVHSLKSFDKKSILHSYRTWFAPFMRKAADGLSKP
jgi:hypothetical protein